MDFVPETGTITMFTTTWCGYCSRLKSQLDKVGIGYAEVNVEAVDGTSARVVSLHGGHRTVPAGLVPDGSAATNPSLAQVQAKLAPAA
jgi:mycoredoxin